LKSLVLKNFEIEFDNNFIFKHMYNSINFLKNKTNKYDFKNVLLLLVSRRISSWSMAMYDDCHECYNMLDNANFSTFLTKKWTSINFNVKARPIIEVYPNIFELRKTKLHLMYSFSKNESIQTLIVDYDTAARWPEYIIDEISKKGAKRKEIHLQKVDYEARKFMSQKKTKLHLQKDRSYVTNNKNVQDIICENTDWDIEKKLNYEVPLFC